MRSDIEVRTPDGTTVLLVEVKARPGKDPAWATQIRRNLLAHGSRPAQYFLLVTPDDSYFWKHTNPGSPDEVVRTRDLLGPRLWRSTSSPSTERALSHLVAAWLGRMTLPNGVEDLSDTSRSLAERTGLLADLQGGSVLVEPT